MCMGKNREASLGEAPFKPSRFAHKNKNLVTNDDPNNIVFNDSAKVLLQEDLLAILTHYTKLILFGIGDLLKRAQKSVCYRILFHTTQPAHVITAISVIMICLMLIPSEKKTNSDSPIWSLVYLGAFSTHFGAQIWMTFVSGLALYFAMPRHTFGHIQKILFPKYFLLNSVLSLITLYVFLRAHRSDLKSFEILTQVATMTLCFLIELIIRLYLTPPLLRFMAIKNKIEVEAGVGQEIGKVMPGELIKSPYYLAVHRAFRKVHMTIAIGNVITMGCTFFQLYYISQKLCIQI